MAVTVPVYAGYFTVCSTLSSQTECLVGVVCSGTCSFTSTPSGECAMGNYCTPAGPGTGVVAPAVTVSTTPGTCGWIWVISEAICMCSATGPVTTAPGTGACY